MLKNFVKDESGQGLAEYALILALIAIVVIAAVIVLTVILWFLAGYFGYQVDDLLTA